jgi:hypothetical protein
MGIPEGNVVVLLVVVEEQEVYDVSVISVRPYYSYL